jgi:uncharacterized protein (DUF58 family)
MLTSRAWWFLLVVLCLLAIAVFDYPSQAAGGAHWTLILVTLTLLLWFLGEWLLFTVRVSLAVPALRVRRELRDARGPVDSLWVGRSFQVFVSLRLPHWGSLPYLRLADHVPFGVELGPGEIETAGTVTAENGLQIGYSIRCPAAGRIRFEGVGIQLTDVQGFFYHVTFIPGVIEYRVLPPLADAEGHRPTVKRHNLLPSPGLHRHLRPGSGSELLDLRDYLPGDPPKTIAWKVSARRDRLITKEFESEVPVRCTLLMDTSHSVRIGPPGQNALARLVEISAAVAQANAGVRDLTGICLFDEQGVTRYVRPARGSRCLVQLLNVLADAAGLAPATGEGRVATLLPLTDAVARKVYPYLFRRDLNQAPSWSAWFSPAPTYAAGSFRLYRRLLHGLFLLLASLPVAGTAFSLYFLGDLIAPLADVFVPLPETLLPIVGVALAASALVLYYGTVVFLLRALWMWLSSKKRRLARQRKCLAAILAERYGLSPGGLGLLLENDEQFSLFMQRFLAEHQVPYPLPLYDRRGRYLFASPGKIDVLAEALVRAVGKGQDNELFVLLVDLLELADQLEPLTRAVRMTLARHHQVLVICPWPPGVPTPAPGGSAERGAQSAEREGADVSRAPRSALRAPLLQRATTDRLHLAFEHLRRAFLRLGVPVVCADGGDPVRLILDRMDRLRSLGMGSRR